MNAYSIKQYAVHSLLQSSADQAVLVCCKLRRTEPHDPWASAKDNYKSLSDEQGFCGLASGLCGPAAVGM